ncbi:hypothetical protein B9Z65_1426 [Elsinoe australis]|uniref:Uncharacterized protein n=1 Tax=Elsinoe australis TaxID=40998 RepID=A0A2P7YFU6_9PEZI|nr:hypothetical protein B9Z65_1426 [Elsinoe australis]
MPKQILSEDDNDDPATPPKPKKLKPSRPSGLKTRSPLASKPRKLRPSRPIGPKNESLVPTTSYEVETPEPARPGNPSTSIARRFGVGAGPASSMAHITMSPATSTSSSEPATLHLIRPYRHRRKGLTLRKQPAFRLMGLPLEIRLMVYKELRDIGSTGRAGRFDIDHEVENDYHTNVPYWDRIMTGEGFPVWDLNLLGQTCPESPAGNSSTSLRPFRLQSSRSGGLH